jgi:hypothetical protein
MLACHSLLSRPFGRSIPILCRPRGSNFWCLSSGSLTLRCDFVCFVIFLEAPCALLATALDRTLLAALLRGSTRQHAEAVGLCGRALLARHAEDKAAVCLDTQRARAGCSPLRLVRVHIDAGVVLLVVPAASQLLSTGAHTRLPGASLAGHHLTSASHAAVTAALLLLHHDNGGVAGVVASRQVARAVGADALLEEACILAGARHAELHGALVGPLLLLARHLSADNLGLVRSIAQRLCLLARRTHLGRLRGVVAHVLQEGNVAKGEAAAVLQPADAGGCRGRAVPLHDNGAAVTTSRPASGRRLGHEPGAVWALPGHRVTAVTQVVRAGAQALHVRAALAARTVLKLNKALGGPGPHCDCIVPCGGHFCVEG